MGSGRVSRSRTRERHDMAWWFRSHGRADAAPGETLGARDAVVTQPRAGTAPIDEALIARFWGVRGSYPTPRVGGGSIGGETTCLEITFGDRSVILDAGSGIIRLGEELMRRANARPERPRDVTLIFTHAHHDHLCGLPFFAPLYDARFTIRFFGPDLAEMPFSEIIAGYMRAPYFPVDFSTLPSTRTLTALHDGDRLLLPRDGAPRIVCATDELADDTLTVDALFSYLHPANGSMIYRIAGGGAKLVFATDVEVGMRGEGGDARLIEFTRGADALVHDAQYSEADYNGSDSKRGFGHSTPQMAAHIARRAGVGRLVLFHHDPHYGDEAVMELQRHGREGFPEVVSAREGLELRLDGNRRRLV